MPIRSAPLLLALSLSGLVLAGAISSQFIITTTQLNSGGGNAGSWSYSLRNSAIGQPFTVAAASSTSYQLYTGTHSIALDVDTDGIPNSWELVNGLNPYDSADALADNDADNRSNLQEYFDGSNPNIFDTGDFNGDGQLNFADLLAFQQYLLGIEAIDSSAISRSDLNRDGNLSLADLLLLQRQLLGW